MNCANAVAHANAVAPPPTTADNHSSDVFEVGQSVNEFYVVSSPRAQRHQTVLNAEARLGRATRAIARAEPLRHALEAELAGVPKHDLSRQIDVLVEL